MFYHFHLSRWKVGMILLGGNERVKEDFDKLTFLFVVRMKRLLIRAIAFNWISGLGLK